MKPKLEAWLDRRPTMGDLISGGGGGHHVQYHKAYGLNLRPAGERIHMVDADSFNAAVAEVQRLKEVLRLHKILETVCTTKEV